ncbi:MAG: prepilin-type cleavage/methylation domain-containing protein [Rhodocyclaceae bacterium]
MKPETGKGMRGQGGVALLEAMIAILLISFGILGIIGLQANSIAFTTDARYRVDAGALADRLVSEIWVNPTNIASYAWAGVGVPDPVVAPWVADVQNSLPGAVALPPLIAVGADNSVTVTVRWQLPNGSPHQHMVIANINQNPEN